MMNSGRKKCHELDPLFTVNWQQDEAALAKMGLSLQLMSMSCQLTKVFCISFSSFCIIFMEGFPFMVGCHFSSQYWLQPGTRGCLELQLAYSHNDNPQNAFALNE